MAWFKRCLISAAAASFSVAFLSSASAQDFQQLVDKARSEAADADFFVSITQPNQGATYQALFAAFEKRFNLTLRYRWQSHHTDYYPLVISEAAAGRRTPDIITSAVGDMVTFDKAGLIEPVDWLKYADALPGLADAVNRTLPELRGKSLAHFDVIYTMVYNTKLTTLDAVPRTLAELVDSKWSRKLAWNSLGSPLELIGLDTGRDRALEMARKLKANRPVFKLGAPGVVAAVANGETAIGFGYTTGAEVQKAKRAPIDWVPLTDYVPLLQQNMTVLKNTPYPDLARLFAAWMVSDEGMQIQEKMEFMGRASPGTKVRERLDAMSPNAKTAVVKNSEDLAQNAALQREIARIFAQ